MCVCACACGKRKQGEVDFAHELVWKLWIGYMFECVCGGLVTFTVCPIGHEFPTWGLQAPLGDDKASQGGHEEKSHKHESIIKTQIQATFIELSQFAK